MALSNVDDANIPTADDWVLTNSAVGTSDGMGLYVCGSNQQAQASGTLVGCHSPLVAVDIGSTYRYTAVVKGSSGAATLYWGAAGTDYGTSTLGTKHVWADRKFDTFVATGASVKFGIQFNNNPNGGLSSNDQVSVDRVCLERVSVTRTVEETATTGEVVPGGLIFSYDNDVGQTANFKIWQSH